MNWETYVGEVSEFFSPSVRGGRGEVLSRMEEKKESRGVIEKKRVGFKSPESRRIRSDRN